MGLNAIRSFRAGNYEGGSRGVVRPRLFWHFVDVIWGAAVFCFTPAG